MRHSACPILRVVIVDGSDDERDVAVDDLIGAALDVLGDVPSWHLAPARWVQVREHLAMLDAAFDRRDVPAMCTAVTTLGSLGPVRLTRIGAVPIEPAPGHIRERVHRVVSLLDQPGSTPAAERRADGGPHARSSTHRP